MPTLDSCELLKAIRSGGRTRRIPVVLLSARAGEESRVEGMQAGADDYLTKPFLHVNCLLGSAQDSKLRGYNTNGSKFAAADLETMTRLHELGTHFVRPGNEVQKCLDATLETAILLTGAAKGSLQRLDEASGKLKIVAQRGFNESFLKFFATVSDRDSADFWGNVGAPPQGISNP